MSIRTGEESVRVEEQRVEPGSVVLAQLLTDLIL